MFLWKQEMPKGAISSRLCHCWRALSLHCGNPEIEHARGNSCASLKNIVSTNRTGMSRLSGQKFRVIALYKTKAYRVKALKKFDTWRLQLSTMPACIGGIRLWSNTLDDNKGKRQQLKYCVKVNYWNKNILSWMVVEVEEMTWMVVVKRGQQYKYLKNWMYH